MLMEPLEYHRWFCWFVGLAMDDTVWVPTTFTTNRDRLLECDTRGLVDTLRYLDVTPHGTPKKQSRPLDRPTTQHAGCDTSRRVRKRIDVLLDLPRPPRHERRLHGRSSPRRVIIIVEDAQ